MLGYDNGSCIVWGQQPCTCGPDNSLSRLLCPEHGSIHVMSSAEIEASLHVTAPWELEPRPQVEALFRKHLGDNIENEVVRQLIDDVVELINAREL